MRRPAIPAVIPAVILAVTAALAGCSGSKPAKERAEQDPAVSAALNEQLMTDPDLARTNAENRVLAGGGPAAAPIPLEDRSPDAVDRARADAARLLGGAITPAPPPSGPSLPPLPRDTPPLAVAAALGPAAKPCLARLTRGFAWAARLPAALPIYPRGHAQDAAGVDGGPCALRAVNFVTPVAPGDVATFYWTAARRSGLTPEHRLAGKDHAVIARKGAATGTVFIHARDDGLTEVDLVTSGL